MENNHYRLQNDSIIVSRKYLVGKITDITLHHDEIPVLWNTTKGGRKLYPLPEHSCLRLSASIFQGLEKNIRQILSGFTIRDDEIGQYPTSDLQIPFSGRIIESKTAQLRGGTRFDVATVYLTNIQLSEEHIDGNIWTYTFDNMYLDRYQKVGKKQFSFIPVLKNNGQRTLFK